MNITLKNVPDSVYKIIKREAKKKRRSLNAEIIQTLEIEAAEAERRRQLGGVRTELKRFADTLEKVCIQTVESGFMTKDLSLLIGPDQPWLSTTGFLDKIDENLQKAMT